jgi:hypothetical protein
MDFDAYAATRDDTLRTDCLIGPGGNLKDLQGLKL